MTGDAYFCDYFRASTPWKVERIVPVLKGIVESDFSSWVAAPNPLYRGEVAMYQLQGGKRVLHVEYGGVYADGCLFLGSGLGGVANRLYGAVRASRMPHRVTRLDVAIDFDRPGVAGQAFEVAQEVAKRYGLAVSMQGDWRSDVVRVGGRTLYVGSRKSAYFLRLYEKGLHPDFLQEGRPNWFRIEAEIKPEKPDDKRVVTGRGLVENFCSRKWAAEIVQAVGGAVVDGITTGRTEQRPDLERQVKTLAMQYKRTIDQLRVLCADDRGVGLYLGLLRDLLEKQGGVHDFRELSNSGSMAEFVAVQANSGRV